MRVAQVVLRGQGSRVRIAPPNRGCIPETSLLGIGRNYEVTGDGQRVLGNFFVRGTGEANRIVIVTNCFAKLERPVPTG